MDVYGRYFRRNATPRELVAFGRWATVALMVVGIVVASGLEAKSIFDYIQKMQLYVSPGIVAVFVFGLINRRGARGIGALALVLSPTLFAAFSFGWPTLHYLHAAAFTLVGTLAAMFALVLPHGEARRLYVRHAPGHDALARCALGRIGRHRGHSCALCDFLVIRCVIVPPIG